LTAIYVIGYARRMDGELDRVDGRWQLRFVRRFALPPEKVWRALTEPEHLAAWFPTDIEGARAAGAPLRFVFRNATGPTLDGEMLVYKPPTSLEFRWGNDETLRFDLRQDGDGTVLTFVNRFDDVGKAARDAAGWHQCLDALRAHLDGEAAPKPGEGWQEVHERYVKAFGPEASTIGPPA
jgi:uncharacterized protein YndB with AHSA1/START domain